MLQFNSGNVGIPIFVRPSNSESNAGNAKLNEDRYEMFVNGEFVGEHTLFAEKEEATDISDFLDKQGFHDVQMDVEGDHILIHCANESEANDVESAVKVFIHNR
ncbi:hypothetical protein ACM26V_16535 [Salipaludibacillus sp. HK11]|uniref:hypothetical protein n=1 Tax=Salipaludibacillus sp. HK11 TaxID=3394320 RepID=UPI0039FC55A7